MKFYIILHNFTSFEITKTTTNPLFSNYKHINNEYVHNNLYSARELCDDNFIANKYKINISEIINISNNNHLKKSVYNYHTIRTYLTRIQISFNKLYNVYSIKVF